LINCTLTDAVSPVAWKLDQSNEGPNVHFWEYDSHAPDSKPLDMTQRLSIARRLNQPADKETIANYSSAGYVLGGNWTPEPTVANSP
jgi:hypothetical protein